jgi:EEF1A lysine methyltransferase 4
MLTNNGEFDDVMSDAAQFGRIQFWDLRYANEHEPFEWYYGYEYFRETIRDVIPLNGKVMIAGCGSSNMPGDMADDGYEDVVASDWSRVVIAQLKYRYRDVPQISYFQGNMIDTDLPEGIYSAIIDKALFDSLLCSQASSTTVAQYVYEVERLLNDDGVFIIISYGNPEQRLHFLEQYDIDEPHFTPWIVEVQALCK